MTANHFFGSSTVLSGQIHVVEALECTFDVPSLASVSAFLFPMMFACTLTLYSRGHSQSGYYFRDTGLKDFVALILVFIMIYYYLINKFYINK